MIAAWWGGKHSLGPSVKWGDLLSLLASDTLANFGPEIPCATALGSMPDALSTSQVNVMNQQLLKLSHVAASLTLVFSSLVASFALADPATTKPAPASAEAVAPAKQPVPAVDKWESAIAKFEVADLKSPPKQGGIVFVGSSSIVGWNTEKWFPEHGVINRGFGGSQLADSVRYAPRIVTPYKPKVVVLYAGDNDLAQKKTPTQIAADFESFVKVVHQECPDCQILYLSVKICESRWKNKDLARETNGLIAKQCEANPLLTFVDLASPLLGEDGMPQNKYFKKDLLHLNEEGYDVWTKTLMPVLDQAVAAGK